MPFMDEYTKYINLSTLVNVMLDSGVSREQVNDVLELVYPDVTILKCSTCRDDWGDGVDRPCIEVDGRMTCLKCKTSVSREYTVTLSVSGTVRVYVTASSDSEAEDMAKEQFDNGDVESEIDWEPAEVDHIEETW